MQIRAIEMTRHAECRAKQRGLPRAAIDAILAFGESRISHGAEVIFMTKAARERARRALDRVAFARMEKWFNAYLVMNDEGALVTCARRTRRLHLD